MTELALPFTAIIVFDTLELGGAERQGLLLARHLKEACGAQVQVWGLTGAPGRVARLCDEAGIPWRAVGMRWQHEVLRGAPNLVALGKLAAQLRSQRPSVILPYTFFSNVISCLVWRLTGAELCIWNQRDAGFFLEGLNPWRSLAVRLTPYFIANSEQGREALIAAFARPDQVTLIHNGVSLAPSQLTRPQWRANLGIGDDTFIACMVANVHSSKDHVTLLRAWRLFLDRGPREAASVLLLAGLIHEEGRAAERLAETLGLGDRVRFLGAVDDVTGLLDAADLGVYSSRTEGLPNGLLESMAAGLPVVATDLPGIREVVGPTGYRFLSPPEDAGRLSALISAFFDDPMLRTSVGRAAQRRVREEFDATKMCSRMVNYIAERRKRHR